MRRPPDDEYPLWLLALVFGIVIVALISAIAIAKAGATDSWLRNVPAELDYATYAHIEPDACGGERLPWRREVWYALRAATISPLVEHQSGRTWLGAICCTLWHESGLQPDAYNPGHNNWTGKPDIGIAQFNAEWTPPALARDPRWSIRTMVRWWRAGLEHRWHAYAKCIRA